jgi:poly(3-hydroxybutyrate) depolymerase
MIRPLLAALALALSVPAPAQPLPVPPALAEAGVQRFRFDGWPGPALPVWYLRPPAARADAPVLFVMHGVGRDADRYIGEWVALARAQGIVLVVPEFPKDTFPGAAAYNNGGMGTPGATAETRARGAFGVIEPLFTAITAREKLTTPRYILYGHSAGAQFVHRYVMTGGGPRLARAIAANAGSYMWPDPGIAFPFGTGGLAPGIWNPKAAFTQPLALLLGTADNDPKHPSLPDQPEAQAQGPHRLARGEAFYAAAKQAAGPGFAWTCSLAPGVGHDNGRMAPFALALILGQETPTAGAGCAAIAAVG